jgi:hypothetical protein
MTAQRLRLSSEPDGSGYFYGSYDAGGDHVYRVDVLPPLSEPRPFFVMANDHAHATDWIVYVDGEEIARVRHRDDIATAVAARLPGR